MNLDHLNEDGVEAVYTAVLKALTDVDDLDVKLEILLAVVPELDNLDNDDFFGTEGWQHRYGLE